MNKIISSVLVKNRLGREVAIPINLFQPVKKSFFGRIFYSGKRVIFTGSQETRQLAKATERYYEKVLKLQKGKKYKVLNFEYSSLN